MAKEIHKTHFCTSEMNARKGKQPKAQDLAISNQLTFCKNKNLFQMVERMEEFFLSYRVNIKY